MNWIQGLLYGFISGITEIMPVSSQAHQRLLLQIFGLERNPISNLIVHISILLAIYIGCRNILQHIRREQRLYSDKRRRAHHVDSKALYDLRLLRSAMIPMMLGMITFFFTRKWSDNNLVIALFCLLGGIIIFIAERFPHGNKDSRHMSVLDAILFGLMSALSVFPGISRLGTAVSYGTVRGVGKQQSLSWALLLSIPALIILCIFDFVDIFAVHGLITNFSVVVGYFTAGLGAFCGAYMCLFFIRNLFNRSGIGIFAYYSWGLALLSFVLYLIS